MRRQPEPRNLPPIPTLFPTPSRPRCVANLYPEASEGGKGGGQRKGDRKRKAEAAADADTGLEEKEIKFTRGCILVIKELAEGQDVLSLRAKFNDKDGGVEFEWF